MRLIRPSVQAKLNRVITPNAVDWAPASNNKFLLVFVKMKRRKITFRLKNREEIEFGAENNHRFYRAGIFEGYCVECTPDNTYHWTSTFDGIVFKISLAYTRVRILISIFHISLRMSYAREDLSNRYIYRNNSFSTVDHKYEHLPRRMHTISYYKSRWSFLSTKWSIN